MIVYSTKIVAFIRKIKEIIAEIITKEANLKCFKGRFYNELGTISYPISVVIYNHKKTLAYFSPTFYELGFHERLQNVSLEQLKSIIRHEIAHYFVHIKYGEISYPHGAVFREMCLKYGWGEDVFRASICLDELEEDAVEESNTLRKVKKLMALSASGNQHEAELALIKSQQLLLKHNLDETSIHNLNDEDKVYLKRLKMQSRINAKLEAIGSILKTFFVNVVFGRTNDGSYLEVVGSAVNVQIAEYVADVLDNEFERLWCLVRGQYSALKGAAAKNSFFLGLAKGYCEKVGALQRACSQVESSALVVVENKLAEAKALVYDRLRTSSSRRSICQDSASLGQKLGKNLSINPALKSSGSNTPKFIT